MRKIFILVLLLISIAFADVSYAFRQKINGVFRDEVGNVIAGGTVSLKLAGTNTDAVGYTTETSTSGVSSFTSASDGSYTIYIDRFDYDVEQQFRLIYTKSGYTTRTIDYVNIVDTIIKTYTITADKSISTHIIIPKGIIYSIASGKTLTFTIPPEIGLYQVFSGSGTVNGLKVSYPEWFGAKADGTTDDSSAITAAKNSLSSTFGGILYLSFGRYKLGSDINIETGYIKVIGQGRGTRLQPAQGVNAITVAQAAHVDSVELKDFTIYPFTGATTCTGITLGSITASKRVAYAKLDGIEIYGFASTQAISLLNVQEIDIVNPMITDNLKGIRSDVGGTITSTHIHGTAGYIGRNGYGIYLDQLTTLGSMKISDIVIESNTAGDIYVSGTTNGTDVTMDGIHFEGGPTNAIVMRGIAGKLAKFRLINSLAYDMTAPVLYADYVTDSYVANNVGSATGGLLQAGGISTTANCTIHFEFNRSVPSVDVMSVYSGLSGNISAKEFDSNNQLAEFCTGKEIRLSRTTGVDMKTAAKTVLYIIPAGRSALITKVIVSAISATLAGGTDFDFGCNSAADTWKQNVDLSAMTSANGYMVITSENAGFIQEPAGAVFGIYPHTGSIGNATATIDIYGYLF